MDILTVADPMSPIDGKSLIAIEAPDWRQQVHLSVENVVFAGQELGRLDVGNIGQSSFHWYLSGHGAGVDLEYGARIDIDAFRYTYNTNLEAFEAGGIHLAESATGDPADPSTWAFDGRFRIGDVFAGNPATLDIVTQERVENSGEQWVSLQLNLPASGSVRIENVRFGNENLGPVAVDGIRIHRLKLDLFPGG
jgi:hypothetical protein